MLVRKIALICLLSVVSAQIHAQTVRYVTDSLRLETEHQFSYHPHAEQR